VGRRAAGGNSCHDGWVDTDGQATPAGNGARAEEASASDTDGSAGSAEPDDEGSAGSADDGAPTEAVPIGRTAAMALAAVCAAAVVALIAVAAVVPPPDRLARGLLVVVAVVLLGGVATGWFRTVRLMTERPH
jgi:hypothetical protein